MTRRLNFVASLAFAAMGDLEALVPGGLTMEALTHPDSLLNFVRIGRMGSQVGDGVVGTYDLLANDATRTMGAWRKRVQDSMDASMAAQEEFLSMLANTHNLPRRVITAILGLNDSNLDASVETLDSSDAPPALGPFGGRLQSGLSDFVSNGISAGYRKAFAPIATTMRMKRSFLGLDRPQPPPTEAPLQMEAPEPVATTTAAPVVTPSPAVPPTEAPNPTAPANFISFPFYMGQQAPPNSFMPMLTQMAAPAAPPVASTTSSVSPCSGEVEQTTKVYIDKFGHLQMSIESPTTVSPSTSTDEQEAEGAEAHFSEAATAEAQLITDTDLLPEGVFTTDLSPPNFHRIDEIVDSLPFEGKYIADHEGQAVEISATDSNVLKDQLKMQLRNKLWTEWVEEIVANNGPSLDNLNVTPSATSEEAKSDTTLASTPLSTTTTSD